MNHFLLMPWQIRDVLANISCVTPGQGYCEGNLRSSWRASPLEMAKRGLENYYGGPIMGSRARSVLISLSACDTGLHLSKHWHFPLLADSNQRGGSTFASISRGDGELSGSPSVRLARRSLCRVRFQGLGSACVRSPVLLTHSAVFPGN